MASLVPPPDLKVQPSVSDHFSWIRTLLSLDRTLMSATRTSVSLIGFGFTVAEFFERIRSNLPEGLRDTRPDTARNLGLILIVTGVVSLAVFIVQYRSAIKYLKSDEFTAILGRSRKPLHQPTYYFAIAVMLIGIAAFIAIVLRF